MQNLNDINHRVQAISNFRELNKELSLHLVELSETLSRMQEEKLSATPEKVSDTTASSGGPHYKSCVSKYGPKVFWYRDVRDVPAGFNMYVAHEFFDALPIHKFQVGFRNFVYLLFMPSVS